MKIRSLLIENFRGIQRVEATDLGDTIIIAGQNGSGKSCIFDAIRLLKAVYGGYVQDELHQLFNEFQIGSANITEDLGKLLNDTKRKCVIEIGFSISEKEKENLKKRFDLFLKLNLPTDTYIPMPGHRQWPQNINETRDFARVLNEIKSEIKDAFDAGHFLGRIVIESRSANVNYGSPNGNEIRSKALEFICKNFHPEETGIIYYHGPHRIYPKSSISQLNYSPTGWADNDARIALSGSEGKSANLKNIIVRSLIEQFFKILENNHKGPLQNLEIIDELNRLFAIFATGKRFIGPTVNAGEFSFEVVTPSGARHDLDELSSGEKEVLLGYLQLRSIGMRDSILLIDEPELHLNPRLVRGLPEFYRKNIGEEHQNQLWLITHSDAMIRDVVHNPDFKVFHMVPCDRERITDSQLMHLDPTSDLNKILIDLVGDLTTFYPGGKAIILEGGGRGDSDTTGADSEFDKFFLNKLFGEELRGINLISGTNKAKVKALYEVLSSAHRKGDFPTKFYAIVDRDMDAVEETAGLSNFTWDAYHIENHLLDSEIIALTLNSFAGTTFWKSESVESSLKHAAESLIPELLSHKMKDHVHKQLKNCIDISFSPKTVNLTCDVVASIKRSRDRLIDVTENTLVRDAIVATEQSFRDDFDSYLKSDAWKKEIPGRRILRSFLSLNQDDIKRKAKSQLKYEPFRNLIVDRMAAANVKPRGMLQVINKICSDPA